MENEYKSGLSRKERNVLQMGFEDDKNGLKDMNEFYVYQNKIRSKVNGTLMDTLLLLKYNNTVFDLLSELENNKDLLKEIYIQLALLIENDKP